MYIVIFMYIIIYCLKTAYTIVYLYILGTSRFSFFYDSRFLRFHRKKNNINIELMCQLYYQTLFDVEKRKYIYT